MPSTIRSLFAAIDLAPDEDGPVPWCTAVPERQPGVYVAALTSSLDDIVALPCCPLDVTQLELLLDRCRELTLDGRRPSALELAARLAAFWFPDETVLYIGLSSTPLRTRVGAYRRTDIGADKPHAGGWWLKTLSVLPDLWVHWAATPDFDDAEDDMLVAFRRAVSPATREILFDSERIMPFANLRGHDGLDKRHGIKRATGPKTW